jgi:hypothetical protein
MRSKHTTVFTVVACLAASPLPVSAQCKQSLSAACAKPLQDVLATDPAGDQAGVPGFEIELPQSGTYRFAVSFENYDERQHSGGRFGGRWRVIVYRFSAKPNQDCDRTLCWTLIKQFSSAGSATGQTWDFRGRAGQRLLVSSWRPMAGMSRGGGTDDSLAVTANSEGNASTLSLAFATRFTPEERTLVKLKRLPLR